ncbi:L-type lectin-domain containing receptor kinase IV.1-like [Ananas comosus]|uniref:non-specific serine/threonine protein kinase n=1 Tax=Ananas comosus TaxID=4615 RepID=A0A6P5F2A1_ANACO|nr:L-type lectin-domain containing receptor kinase IV.1-like [Ananas comosus]
MFSHIALFCLVLFVAPSARSSTDEFVFNGFKRASNLSLDGYARITNDGAIQLTNETMRVMGHAFFSSPVRMLDSQHKNLSALSFSTIFVFDIITADGEGGGTGLTFVMSPSKTLPQADSGAYLGLFGAGNNGNFSNHVFAVEFDTAYIPGMFNETNDNHVGIDINSIISNISTPAGYYSNDSKKVDLELEMGKPIQVWIEYSGDMMVVNVTIAPLSVPKPSRPLISYTVNLSPIFKEHMYVGFSGATGQIVSSHYILGWSFQTNGMAAPLDISQLSIPQPPSASSSSNSSSMALAIKIGAITSIATLIAVGTGISIFFYLQQRAKLAETLEDWELDHPHRFRYKDLYKATKGFKETELLGRGGFGHVFKGVIKHAGEEVAVKKISHNTRQGIREFIAEIASLGRMRHRHLVELKGWCKRNEDLLLVYEFMPKGSLDMLLFDGENSTILSWQQRFKILKGVAAGILYLHQEWEQVVVHRDIKASNVLLDATMDAKISDFGLARLYEHGNNLHTTHVVGTLGYMAPELSRTGRSTTSSDVFAFGALLLEVACGRRPIKFEAPPNELSLVDWVRECQEKGELLQVADSRLQKCYNKEEMELVLKLGLVCCQSVPEVRPSMKQVIQYLNGDEHLADDAGLIFSEGESLDLASVRISYASSYAMASTSSLTGGR